MTRVVINEAEVIADLMRLKEHHGGYLVKKGGFIPTWKKRFFHAANDGSQIIYWTSDPQVKDDDDNAPRKPPARKGSFNGRHCTLFLLPRHETGGRSNCFGVRPVNSSRTYVLQASSAAECRAWTLLFGEWGGVDVAETPAAEGYLLKLGKVVSNMKIRWFTLTKQVLRYAEARGPDAKILGEMVIDSSVTVDPDTTLDKGDYEFVFSVTVPGHRAYKLVANSAEDRQRWVDALEAARAATTGVQVINPKPPASVEVEEEEDEDLPMVQDAVVSDSESRSTSRSVPLEAGSAMSESNDRQSFES